ncbi:iron-containing alcohol dehydrogenase family protein [Actinopolymorpha alba]|uniref:iron-containing alcohol dehydrogenase family protein n=1 Tax=Actinopolymorpha alba TaxID=533267 RepID=UPI0003708987|nr:iron-containing alcohol dehydrogenase family protein [Actinopolymorpha alba]
MITTPVVVDIRRGAIADLADLLADQRISAGGRVAVAVGPRSGGQLTESVRPTLREADFYTVEGGTVDAALRLAGQVRGRSYDAIVGVGGGKVLDVTKFAAARLGLPMVAVATNLAHDGIGSPVSILDNDAGRGSYGVPAPIAVIVDLDVVRQAPARSVRAGIGEVLSNLSAIADWELSRDLTGEPVDGLAVTLARTAAEAVAHHPGTLVDDDFLRVLAEGLVLSGLAMVVAGSTRPCSGACHEISHAIDLLYPERAGAHGEQVGLGAAFASTLWDDPESRSRGTLIANCLVRHGLPVTPAALGFSLEEFTAAVVRAPETRPGRFTILEHRDLDKDAVVAAVRAFSDRMNAAYATTGTKDSNGPAGPQTEESTPDT